MIPPEPVINTEEEDEQPTAWGDAQRILAYALVGSFVGVVVLLIFHPLPADSASSSMINTLVGVLGTMASTVSGYYFGSSKGSTVKDNSRDRTLTKLVDKVVTNGELGRLEKKV